MSRILKAGSNRILKAGKHICQDEGGRQAEVSHKCSENDENKTELFELLLLDEEMTYRV